MGTKQSIANAIRRHRRKSSDMIMDIDCVEGSHGVSLQLEKCGILGEGSFGRCYLARNKCGVGSGKSSASLFALKTLPKTRYFRRSGRDTTHLVWNERDALVACAGGRFIVQLEACLQTETHLTIVTEVYEGGNLMQHIKRMHNPKRKGGPVTTEEVGFYAAELVLALEHLHAQGYAHRDVKPDNVFIGRDGHLALGDLGLACRLDETNKRSIFWNKCGSFGYRAPEVVRGQRCGTFSDIYSLGIALYYLAFSGVPWKETTERLMREEKTGCTSLFFPKAATNISNTFCHLLSSMLCVDKHRRITLEEIKKHRALAWVDWEAAARGDLTPPWVPNINDKEAHSESRLDKMARRLRKQEKWEDKERRRAARESGEPEEEPALTLQQQARFLGLEFVSARLLPHLTITATCCDASLDDPTSVDENMGTALEASSSACGSPSSSSFLSCVLPFSPKTADKLPMEKGGKLPPTSSACSVRRKRILRRTSSAAAA